MLDARAAKLTALEGHIQKLEAELAAQLQELTGKSHLSQSFHEGYMPTFIPLIV